MCLENQAHTCLPDWIGSTNAFSGTETVSANYMQCLVAPPPTPRNKALILTHLLSFECINLAPLTTLTMILFNNFMSLNIKNTFPLLFLCFYYLSLVSFVCTFALSTNRIHI